MSSKNYNVIKELQYCCREVRLGATPCKKGDKLSGWNNETDEYEEWVVIKVDENNNWKSLVKRTNVVF